jgi:hypothetical protein
MPYSDAHHAARSRREPLETTPELGVLAPHPPPSLGLALLLGFEVLDQGRLRDQPLSTELEARQHTLAEVAVDGILVEVELSSDPIRVAEIELRGHDPSFPGLTPINHAQSIQTTSTIV